MHILKLNNVLKNSSDWQYIADCKACDYARNNNIPVIEYPKRKAAENEKFPTELVASLRYNARFVYFLIFNRVFFLCN